MILDLKKYIQHISLSPDTINNDDVSLPFDVISLLKSLLVTKYSETFFQFLEHRLTQINNFLLAPKCSPTPFFSRLCHL